MNFENSLKELTASVPKEKIYLLQISDAYKPPRPLKNEAIEDLRPRGRWSHDFRPYPFGGGQYTEQVVVVAKAVLGTGSRAWFSTEVFDGGAKGDGVGGGMDGNLDVFCKGAMESHRKLLDACADS